MTENWAAAPYLSDEAARQLYAEVTGCKVPDRRTFHRYRTGGGQRPGGDRMLLQATTVPVSRQLRYRRDDVLRFAVAVGGADLMAETETR